MLVQFVYVSQSSRQLLNDTSEFHVMYFAHKRFVHVTYIVMLMSHVFRDVELFVPLTTGAEVGVSILFTSFVHVHVFHAKSFTYHLYVQLVVTVCVLSSLYVFQSQLYHELSGCASQLNASVNVTFPFVGSLAVMLHSGAIVSMFVAQLDTHDSSLPALSLIVTLHCSPAESIRQLHHAVCIHDMLSVLHVNVALTGVFVRVSKSGSYAHSLQQIGTVLSSL